MRKSTQPTATIIADSRDALRDRTMPLAEAKTLFAAGKLAVVDMGSSYPNAFQFIPAR